MTELEAVNEMLETIGEQAVEDLTSGLYEATLALSKLRTVSREVQTVGWTFNTDNEYPLAVNTAGEIPLPENALKVDISDTERTYRDVTVRAHKLYDRVGQTFSFSGPVLTDIVWGFPFDDLPVPAQNYIYMKAARRFQKHILGSQTIDGFAREDELSALVELEAYEAQDGNYNILTNSTFGQRLYKGRR